MSLGVEQEESVGSPPGPPSGTRVLDAVRLVSRSTSWAVVVGGAAVLLSAAFPIFLFLTVPFALGLVLAAWIAAVGAGAGSLAGRGPNARLIGGGLGALLAVACAVLIGRGIGLGPWSAGADLLGWAGLAVVWGGSGLVVVMLVAMTAARKRVGARRGIVLGLLASGVAAGAVAVAAAVTAWAQRPWFDPDDTCGDGGFEVRAFPVQVFCTSGGVDVPLAPPSLEVLQVGGLVVAGILLIGALVVSTTRGRAARTAATSTAGIAGVAAIAVVVWALLTPPGPTVLPAYLGTSGGLEQPMLGSPPVDDPDAAAQPPAPDAPDSPADPAPTLDEGREQFARLAAAALTAAGEGAIWRDSPPLGVREEACADGTRLVIDGEFATGVITDATSDEHDREVTAGNVAAADRIASAWHAAGLGSPERLHDEPHLGAGSLAAVESARVSFDFGVAQPRVEGHCLVGGSAAG
jgi:hypothetical protein